jgi:hypothetical protein
LKEQRLALRARATVTGGYQGKLHMRKRADNKKPRPANGARRNSAGYADHSA